jgi:GNAT superfamily N-acetyltransferase
MEQAGRLILEGFSEGMPFPEDAVPTMLASLEVSHVFLAGQQTPVAAGLVGFRSGVALFYGDATLAAARRSGWQSKLIQARLTAAQRDGCDLAAVSVLPGSGSHRNYERAGFQLIYMRVNVSLDLK